MVTLLIACILIYSLKMKWYWYMVAVFLHILNTGWKKQVIRNFQESNLILINRLDNIMKKLEGKND